jgi:hypothetical protein
VGKKLLVFIWSEWLPRWVVLGVPAFVKIALRLAKAVHRDMDMELTVSEFFFLNWQYSRKPFIRGSVFCKPMHIHPFNISSSCCSNLTIMQCLPLFAFQWLSSCSKLYYLGYSSERNSITTFFEVKLVVIFFIIRNGRAP